VGGAGVAEAKWHEEEEDGQRRTGAGVTGLKKKQGSHDPLMGLGDPK
jgi:hypothetical protein